MSYVSKPLEQLDLLDDFLINAVASDEHVGIPCCRKILSVLLQREIGKIRITAQKVFPGVIPGLRGIRMDVEIEEFSLKNDSTLNVYDLEPHLQKGVNFPKHNRFYQAKIDSRYMRSGDNDFSKMPNLYVITITNYDLFGKDYMMYTFRNKCVEVPELPYEDGLQFIYFNTTGKNGGCKEISDLLRYMENSNAANAVDDTTTEIHRYVEEVKITPEVRNGYMRFDDIIAWEREDAVIENMVQNILDLLNDYGPIPDSLKERLVATTDLHMLKHWLKLAAKSDSLEAFLQQMEQAPTEN